MEVNKIIESTMDNDEVILSAQGISKCYHLYNNPADRLKEQLLTGFGKKYSRDLWALDNISFEIKKGETFGIIGRNGSGKSTLLQIIANILKATKGRMVVNGKVAALLELGSGFNPEYTGRENVYLNAAVLGISNNQIEERLQEIIDFAEIGDFIDQPVKTYSSGMFVRLAFAITISLDAEILLIDEALAVGDVFFRQKCYKRLEELRQKGTTIILVTHATGEIEQFCQRALLLDKGKQLFLGNASEAVKRYYLVEQSGRINRTIKFEKNQEEKEAVGVLADTDSELIWPGPDAFFDLDCSNEVSNHWGRCTGVALCNNTNEACRVFSQGEKAVFYYEFEVLEDIEIPIAGLVIYNDKNLIIHGKNTLQYNSKVPIEVKKGNRIRLKQEVQLDLQEGDYTFEIGLAAIDSHHYKLKSTLSYYELNERIIRICHRNNVGYFSIILNKRGYPKELLHHGICDLPGDCKVELYGIK